MISTGNKTMPWTVLYTTQLLKKFCTNILTFICTMLMAALARYFLYIILPLYKGGLHCKSQSKNPVSILLLCGFQFQLLIFGLEIRSRCINCTVFLLLVYCNLEQNHLLVASIGMKFAG